MEEKENQPQDITTENQPEKSQDTENDLQDSEALSEETKEKEVDQEDSSQSNRGVEDKIDEELLKLENQLSESKDKYLRLYSEYENYRRRTSKEKIDLIKTANEDLMSALLPVLDDFDRALQNMPDEESNRQLAEGFQLIHNKFFKLLQSKGLSLMEVEKGSEFNPEFHEAISQIPAPEEDLKGKVIDVVERGYYLGEKVVRFAKVVIGS